MLSQPPNAPRSFTSPYPFNFMFYLSFKRQQKKKVTKNHELSFVLANYSLTHGACPRVWWIDHLPLHWRKVIFIPPSSYCLWTLFYLGLGFYAHFPFFMLGVCQVWACTGLVNAVTVSVVNICLWPAVPGKHSVPLKSFTVSGSYNHSDPSSAYIPEHFREGW